MDCMTDIEVLTKDGVTLRARLHRARDARGVVIINPGTATKTSYYLPFARYLNAYGLHVMLWNYRGFCDSKLGDLKDCQYRYSDIGHYDIPAVIDSAKHLFPDLPLYCVGHSTGGQQVGLAYNAETLDALIAVAVSAGYFGYMPAHYRLKANLFFRVFAPVSSKIFHYVPAKSLHLMEDLPSGFTEEWGAWCQEKQLFFSDKFYGKTISKDAYKDFNVPTFVFTADDDEICTERNVHNFWCNVTASQPITFKRYQTQGSTKPTIGHFGYFRTKNRYIWKDILEAIDKVHYGKARHFE